jgi:hypothetical protein
LRLAPPLRSCPPPLALPAGTGEAWSAAQLGEVIKFDHGYSPCSPPVLALLEVLAELDGVDQRRHERQGGAWGWRNAQLRLLRCL